MQNSYDIRFPSSPKLAEAREQLTHHVLLTDLVAGLSDSVPKSLASVKVASSPNAIDFLRHLIPKLALSEGI